MNSVSTKSFTSLDEEIRTAVDTATAAYHLGRKSQTLRGWACFENGPIRPLRINGRLAWPVKELRRVLGCAPFPISAKGPDHEKTTQSVSTAGDQA